jgi:hypothetical protein
MDLIYIANNIVDHSIESKYIRKVINRHWPSHIPHFKMVVSQWFNPIPSSREKTLEVLQLTFGVLRFTPLFATYPVWQNWLFKWVSSHSLQCQNKLVFLVPGVVPRALGTRKPTFSRSRPGSCHRKGRKWNIRRCLIFVCLPRTRYCQPVSEVCNPKIPLELPHSCDRRFNSNSNQQL